MPPKQRHAGSATTTSTTPSKPSTSSYVSTSAKSHSTSSTDASEIARSVWNKYLSKTPQRVKLLDSFMAFLVVVGALQFLYCCLVGNFPFNAFLSGFSATVGQFVLTASLRIQTNPDNKSEFESISAERAFADYVFGSLLLHFFCVNFIN
ncbi:DAD family-domain-containing protein [Clohesyomyces aquaticus]|uniref:Dolichyl-diphosphooligosaccharide--protein glycosyltransferase subunit OST2 n=1 Tax=Clohesyomyces aquaticus TaxID=1231657 RepID=A0A1Y1ZD58_9PLEO|nr:DAD family-domain-containing protein [Clohesyomyces aquaticus]